MRVEKIEFSICAVEYDGSGRDAGNVDCDSVCNRGPMQSEITLDWVEVYTSTQSRTKLSWTGWKYKLPTSPGLNNPGLVGSINFPPVQD